MARGIKATKAPTYAADGMKIMPDLPIRDADTKYTGGEPLFPSQPDPDRRSGALAEALNWYSRYCDRKIAKEQLALYVETFAEDTKVGVALAKQLRKVDEKELITTYGWVARLGMRGLQLTADEKSRLDSEIQRLVVSTNKPVVVEAEPEDKTPRTNVQEVMRERARDAAGELEGCLDDFIIAGAKAAEVNINPVGILSQRNILPQHISILSEVWKKKLTEFQDVLDGKDLQLVEGYSQYTKHQIKAVIKFVEQVLSGLDSYISVKKANKAPRKRKAVSPEKQAAKVKYLKTFDELKLSSVHPAKLIGAVEVWAYDTAKRKLHYYIADSHVGTLGIKGTTILGFDSVKSGVKTLRKPADQLKKLLAAGKPASRKLFTEINAVQAVPNGRTNENMIILKVY